MGQRDFLEAALRIPAKHLLLRSDWCRALRVTADASVAICLALTVNAAGAGATAGQTDARFEPRRPAPVTGRVVADVPSAVVPQVVSTAVQVPPPAHMPAAPHDLFAQTGPSHGVSRETTAPVKAKLPREDIVHREAAGKAPKTLTPQRRTAQAGNTARHAAAVRSTERSSRKGSGRATPRQALATVAQSSVRGNMAPQPRSKASQSAARAAATLQGHGPHRRSPMAIAAKAARPGKSVSRAQRAVKPAANTAHTASPAKAKKHGVAARSAKLAAKGATPVARRQGV